MYVPVNCYKHGTVAATTRDHRGGAGRPGRVGRAIAGLPPASFFGVSAVFHYLGPSLAVLLFARVSVLGVVWLRIASAAVVFAVWRRPWRLWPRSGRSSSSAR